MVSPLHLRKRAERHPVILHVTLRRTNHSPQVRKNPLSAINYLNGSSGCSLTNHLPEITSLEMYLSIFAHNRGVVYLSPEKTREQRAHSHKEIFRMRQ
jgi:hypothetical protein